MKSMKLKKFKVCLTGKANVGKTAIYNVARDKPYNDVPHDDRDIIRIQAMGPSSAEETVEVSFWCLLFVRNVKKESGSKGSQVVRNLRVQTLYHMHFSKFMRARNI